MHWEQPEYLSLLWLIPLLVFAVQWVRRRQQASAATFAEPVIWPRLARKRSVVRSACKLALVTLGLTCLVAALCRPQFGEERRVVAARGIDVFVLLDVSRSMLAEDVAPNRLERAKSDIRDLVQALQADRIGLIAFAGAAEIEVPLTADFAYFRKRLDAVDTESAPRGGSMIGDTIRRAIRAMPADTVRDRVLVLITDGDDQESAPRDAAQTAAEAGIRIFTVGLGDPGEGARIPIRDESGNLQYLTHEGQHVWSRVNEELLREIARIGGGAYVPALTSSYDLGRIYEQYLEGLVHAASDERETVRRREQYQWFVLLGLLLLVLEPAVSEFESSSEGMPRVARASRDAGRRPEGNREDANLKRLESPAD